MKAKELLMLVIGTGFSKSSMQKIFNAAHQDDSRADKIAEILKENLSEEDTLRMVMAI